jgi:glycosyltransferase involved in cell wall biosynthesis
MTFVLKQPTANCKGIVLFRHSERRSLFLNETVGRAFTEAMQVLKQNYIVGCHWGWYEENVTKDPYIELYMAGPHTMSRAPENDTFYIPLSSRNFNPSYFKINKDCPKHWDIICIANSTRIKCIDELFQTYRLVLDKRPGTRFLLISPVDEGHLDPKRWYTEFFDDLIRLFNKDEQKHMDVMQIKRKESLYPVSSETIAFLLQASRVFTLYSNIEGHSRVIHEAILSGLPVVAKSYLKGGGLDYLDETNSRLFNTNEEAAAHFIDLLDNPIEFDTAHLRENLDEEYTIPKLKTHLEQYYATIGQTFDGEIETEGLSHKIPGHARLLPKYLVGDDAKVDELKDEADFVRFVDYLCGTQLAEKYQLPTQRQPVRPTEKKKKKFLQRLQKSLPFLSAR